MVAKNYYCRQYASIIHITSKQLHKYGTKGGASKENLSGDAEMGDTGSGFVVKKNTPQKGESRCCHGKGKEGGGGVLGGDVGVGAYA